MSYMNDDSIEGRIAFDAGFEGFEGPDGWYKVLEDRLVIYVRGTWFDNNRNAPMKGKGDIWNNLEFGKRGEKWHRGYRRYAHTIVEYLCANLVLADKTKDVYVYGHSAGGAQAIILADVLLSLGHNVRSVCTFGTSPFVGSMRCVRDVENYFERNFVNVLHWVNRWDWTRILRGLCWLCGKYLPFGKRTVVVGREGNLVFHPFKSHDPESYDEFLDIFIKI